jgi:hypothetical protein
MLINVISVDAGEAYSFTTHGISVLEAKFQKGGLLPFIINKQGTLS